MSKARGLADLGNVYNDGALSNRNLIINGAMQVAQRPARATGGYSAPFYAGPDRWLISRSGTGNTSFSQIASTDFGGVYAAQPLYLLATSESWNVQQRIESKNIAHLAGQEVTLSFYVSCSVDVGTTTMLAAMNYANSVDNFSADTEISNSSVSYTGTATKFTFTFTLPSSAVNGVSVVLRGVKSGGTGTVTLSFGGVQLEAGDTATPFEHRSYGQELSLCQRYYEVDNPNTPTNFAGNMRAQAYHPTNGSGGPLNRDGPFQPFKVDKRTFPTVTTYAYNGTSGAASGITGAGTDTNVQVRSTLTGFQLSSSTYRSLHVWFAWAADAEL